MGLARLPLAKHMWKLSPNCSLFLSHPPTPNFPSPLCCYILQRLNFNIQQPHYHHYYLKWHQYQDIIIDPDVLSGAKKLIAKIKEFNPKIAVFNGKGIYEVFSGQKEFIFGKQPEKIRDTETVGIFHSLF